MSLNARINSLAGALGGLDRANAELMERAVDAHDQERGVIAHELHDEFGPHLFALRASASVLSKKLDGRPEARAAAAAIASQVEALQNQNRRILANLRPAALEELGLVEALGGAGRPLAERRARRRRLARRRSARERARRPREPDGLSVRPGGADQRLPPCARHRASTSTLTIRRADQESARCAIGSSPGSSSGSRTTGAGSRTRQARGWALPACATASDARRRRPRLSPRPKEASRSRRVSDAPEGESVSSADRRKGDERCEAVELTGFGLHGLRSRRARRSRTNGHLHQHSPRKDAWAETPTRPRA